jgi:hypothetical protein
MPLVDVEFALALQREQRSFLVFLTRWVVCATGVFAVPKTLLLLAVPLFELYDNSERYGAVLAGIPQLISRYDVIPNFPKTMSSEANNYAPQDVTRLKDVKVVDSAQEDAASEGQMAEG